MIIKTNLRQISTTNSALRTFIPQALTRERVRGIDNSQNLTPSRMANVYFTFQRYKKHLKPLWCPYSTSSRSSPLWGSSYSKDFSSEPSSSSNESPLISADSYTILFSFTFITCNITQRWHLWTEVDFPAYNPNKSATMITVVTTNRHVQIVWLQWSRPHLSVSMPTAQSSISRPPPPMRRRLGILILIISWFHSDTL